MRKFSEKAVSVLLSAALLLNSPVIYAEEQTTVVLPECTVTVPAIDLGITDDELLLGYFENKLWGIEGGISTFGSLAGSYLEDDEEAIYNQLLASAKAVAAGEQASTVLSTSDNIVFTFEELGFASDSTDYQAIAATANALITEKIKKVKDALIGDNPYEFYWFDKTAGVSLGANSGITIDSGTIIYPGVYFQFSPGSDYKGSEDYTVDTAKTAAASEAAAKAQTIVDAAKDMSDIEKLTYYKEQICTLVEYNDAAASSSMSAMGTNPWQVIYVFDGNTSTNVVCEGYSKAFQYLCDLTEFEDSTIACYCAEGYFTSEISGSGSYGQHMWNIVTIGGKNYLADITNCDGDTTSGSASIGAPDKLFLAGMTVDSTNSLLYTKEYTAWNNKDCTVSYEYDKWEEGTSTYCQDYLGTAILTLSAADYTAETSADISDAAVTQSGTLTYNGEAQTPEFTVVLGGKTLTAGTDYTVTVTAQTNAGDYTATIAGAGNYTGEKAADWTIAKADPVVAAPTAAADTFIYSGSAQTLINAGSTTGGTMQYKLGDNGTWSTALPSATDAGIYTVFYRVVGDDNYNDVDQSFIQIRINADSSIAWTAMVSEHSYTGAEQTVTVTVCDRENPSTILPESEYTVKGTTSATNAGTYNLQIQLSDNYGFAINSSWTIDSKDIAEIADGIHLIYNNIGDHTIVIANGNSLTYTGEALTPDEFCVYDGDLEADLTENTDFTVAYPADMTNAGEKTITVTGKGNYTGTAAMTFEIKPIVLGVYALLDENGEEISIEKVYDGTSAFDTTGVKQVKMSYEAEDYSTQYITLTVGTDCTLSINFNSADVGEGVGYWESINPVTGGKYDNDNYELAGASVYSQGDITARPITVTIENRTIGDTDEVPQADDFNKNITSGTLADGHTLNVTARYETTPTAGASGTYTVKGSASIIDESDNDVTANYNITIVDGSLAIVKHAHDWKYTASGDTITAACHGTIGTCDIAAAPTITVKAPENLTYDGSAKTATVERSDASAFETVPEITYYDVNGTSISGAPTNAGTYTAQISVGDVSAEVEFTIGKLAISNDNVEVATNNFVYTGQKKTNSLAVDTITLTINGKSTDIKGELVVTDTTTEYSNAGTYTVTLEAPEDSNYTGTVTAEWEITKADITTAVFGDDDLNEVVFTKAYDGKTSFDTSAVTGIKFGDGAYIFNDGEHDDFTLTVTSADANVGENKTLTAVITLSDSMKGNFNKESYTVTLTGSVTQAKAKVTAAPAAKTGLVFNNSAQELITAGTAEDGTMMYSTDGTSWSENIPTAVNADDYTVYYKAEPTDTTNYASSDIGNLTVAVAPFDLANAYVGDTEFEYRYVGYIYTSFELYIDENKTYNIIANGGCDFSAGTGGENLVGEYTTVFEAASSNFTGSKTIEWKIVPGDIVGVTYFRDADIKITTITKEFDGTTAFDTSDLAWVEVEVGEEKKLSQLLIGMDADVTITFDDSSIGANKAYTVTVTPKGDMAKNFNNSSYSFTLNNGEITKVKAKVTAAPTAKTGLVYDGTAQELITAGTAEGGTMMYSLTGDGTDWSEDIPEAENAGDYKVYYYVMGTNGFDDSDTAYIEVNIAQARPEFTAPEAVTGLVFNGGEQTLAEAGAVTSVNGTFWYSLTGADYSTSLPVGTLPKTYTAFYKFVPDDTVNYYTVESKVENIVISSADIKAVSITVYNKTYSSGVEWSYTVTFRYDNRIYRSGYFEITGDTKGTDVGEYNITITAIEGNGFTGSVEKTWKITPAIPVNPATPTAQNEITYGDALSQVTLSDTSWSWSDGTVIPTVNNSGYEAQLTVDDKNYDYTGIDGYDSVSHTVKRTVAVTVAPADVTVKADDKYIIVGAALPEATYTVTGLADGEALTANPTIGYSGADNMTIGEYDIVVSGAEASENYNAVTHINGKLYVGLCDHANTTVRKYDADSHWFDCTKCSATGLSDEAHSGGTATCTEKAECGACGQEYGTTDDANHANISSVWAYDTDGHWHNCECGEKFDYDLHTGGTAACTKQAVCETCKIPYGTALGHAWENEWASNSTHHWHECGSTGCSVTDNSAKSGYDTHTYGEWTVITAATVKDSGLEQRVCGQCGYIEERTIPATGETGTGDNKPAVTTPVVTTTSASSVTSVSRSDNEGGDGSKPAVTTSAVTTTSASSVTSVSRSDNEGGDGSKPAVTIPAVTTPSASSTTSVSKSDNFGGNNDKPAFSTTTSATTASGNRPSWVPNPAVTTTAAPAATTTENTTTTLPPEDDEEILDDDIYEDDDAAEPQIKGDNGKMGWEVIADELADADDGDTVVVDMNGATEVPEDIFRQIIGKDIDLVLEMDNGFIWTVNGESVTAPMTVDMGVELGADIPVKVINNVTGENYYITISLAHNGEFGFTAVLTVDMGDENAGYYANLYYYTGEDAEFICADKISSKGKADLTFTHASEYVIVVDDYDHGKTAEDMDEIIETEDDDINPFTAVTISFTGVIISAAAVVLTRKRKNK